MPFNPDQYLSEKTQPSQPPSAGFDPDSYLAEKEGPGLLSKAAGYGGMALRGAATATDYATGAAPRAALGAMQKGQSPFAAFVSQYFKPPSSAPTGEDLAHGYGVSDKPLVEMSPEMMDQFKKQDDNIYLGDTAGALAAMGREASQIPRAKAVGAIIEGGANLLNIVPALGLAGKAATAASEIPLIEKIAVPLSRGAEAMSKAPAKGATWAINKATDIPKKAIEVYASRGPEVNQLLQSTGEQLPLAADAMKEKVLDSIAQTKKGLSTAITQDLANNPAKVDVNPIIKKLQEAKSKINIHYNPGDAAQIDEMIAAINNTAPDGVMGLNDLYETKNFLQTRSQGAFVKNGELFTSGDKAQKAAMDARKLAADSLHTASPEIAHADSVYSDLHDLDNKMSASLLGTGKSENYFAAAGGGKGNVQQAQLGEIGKITGTDPVKDAEILYSAQQMQKHKGVRTTAVKLGLDAARNASNLSSGIPSGSPSATENILQLLGGNRTLAPAYSGGNAVDRRLSKQK